VAALTASVATVALLAACTGDSEPRAGGTSAGGVTTPAGAPAPTAPVEGAPADLASLVERLYGGADLGKAASAETAKVLAGRTGPGAAVPAGAKAAVGSWFDTPIAVVTAGDDVTLAVGPTWQVVGGWWPSLGTKAPALGGGPRWVLALGSDARKGQNLARSRADTLQVVGLDGTGGGGVMGMARDLWVPLSTGGKGKINSAMALGGPAAQLATVRKATGLPIEGYAVIGFEGFKKLIDDQGGIPIVVPETVNASHARLVIKKGARVLSGKEALAYARERKTLPDGDFGRSRHQGQLLVAAAIKAKLAGPIAVPGALTSFSSVGQSDLSAEEMLTFAAGLYRVNPTKVGRGVAAGPFGWAGSQSIVVLGDQARRLFASFADGNLS
jgi:LCP family protein required for cell wall assembly